MKTISKTTGCWLLFFFLALQASAQEETTIKRSLFLKAGSNYSVPFQVDQERDGGLGGRNFHKVTNLTAQLGYQIGFFFKSPKKAMVKFTPEVNFTANRFSYDYETSLWIMGVGNIFTNSGKVNFHVLYLKIPLTTKFYLFKEKKYYLGFGPSLKFRVDNISKWAFDTERYFSQDPATAWFTIEHDPPLFIPNNKIGKSTIERELEIFGLVGGELPLKNGRELILEAGFYRGLSKISEFPALGKWSIELNIAYPIYTLR